MKPDEKKEIRLFDRKTIIVLAISTILGFLIAFMFYKIADIKRKPTFLVNPLRSNIVNFRGFASSAPDSIIASIQNYIPEDLNILTYYFFNQGKKPIKKDNILSDKISIQFKDPSKKIINHKTIHTGRKECLIRGDLNPSLNRIDLDFKILEKNDGIIGQIVYLGELEGELVCKGTFEGVGSIKLNYFSLDTYLIIILGLNFTGLIYILSKRRKLFIKYRMVLLKEETFEEVGNMRLTRLNLLALVSIVLILFIAIIYLTLYGLGYIDTSSINNFRIPQIK